MEAPTIGMLGTVAGIGFIGTIIVEALLRAAQPSATVKDRFGPILALGVGVTLGVVGAVAAVPTPQDPLTGILVGLVAGGTSMGIHDVVAGPVAKTLNG